MHDYNMIDNEIVSKMRSFTELRICNVYLGYVTELFLLLFPLGIHLP